MHEKWKDIAGFKGIYQVSNLGRVKSLDRKCLASNGIKYFKKGCLLKPSSDRRGYLVCNLSKDNKMHTQKIHRLVANAFLDNVNNLPVVNHKDENKMNNNVSNLEWCTRKYNSNYGHMKEHHRNNGAYKRRKIVIQKDLNGRTLQEFHSVSLAAKENSLSQGGISMVCRGNGKTYGGFKWEYK